MKTKIMNILGSFTLALVLTACSSQKPQTMSASVVTSNVISPGSNSDFVQNVGDSAYFDTNKSFLRDDAKSTLAAQSKWLNQYPQYTVEICGHCDERGSESHNLALGQRRAEASKQYLIKQGVAAHRISTTSLGKSFPLVEGSTEEAWQKNRVSISLLLQGGKAIEVPAGVEQAIAVIKNGQVIPTDGAIINPAA